ncbi:MAG: hypothetical protein HUJ66_08690 [Oscillospiraceae bacterium]|nr:hypothetical protein [Oscillospiraceae bacterium]
MKTKASRLTAVILVITLLAALGVPALAQESESGEVFRYVSLGASNSNGYALHGYLTEEMYANPILSGAQTGTPGDISGYRRTPPYSYPALVKEYFENLGYTVEHAQLAQSSMRVEELRFLLDESFTTDEYMRWRFYAPDNSWTWWHSNLDALREDYRQSITEADFITYDMGLNNFGVYLTNNLMSHSYGNDLHYVIDDGYADLFYSLRGRLESAVTALGIVDQGTLDTVDDLMDTMAYALLGYCTSFDATIGIIREWNPDASLVVLNVQNIMAGLELSVEGISIPLGDIVGAVTTVANTYTSLLSPYAGEYLYADVTENGRVTCFIDQLAEYNGDPDTLDRDMRDCLDVYDTALPMYLKFRVAARIAAFMGDETAIAAETDKKVFRSNLPYFAEFCEENCPELYEKTLSNAYDVIMSILQAGIAVNPVPAGGLLGGADTGRLEDELVDKLFETINNVTDANLAGGSFSDEDIKNAVDYVLYCDDAKAVAAIGIRASIGNTFFSHPNRQGCRELFEAVINAYEKDIDGSAAFTDMMKEASENAVRGTVGFGVSAAYALIDSVASALGLDESVVSALKQMAPDADNIAELIIRELGIRDIKDLSLILDCIEEVAEKMREPGHSLVRVEARKATVFAPGNVEYYVCADCGRLFADPQGLTETDASSVTVPRLSVTALIKALFRR